MRALPRPSFGADRSRVLGFAAVGGGVFLLGSGLLVLLVSGLGVSPVPAGLVSTAVSLEANFLLSRRVTWPDRAERGFRAQWIRFHAARAGTVVANQALYSALVLVGIPYLAAIVATTALATLVNFVMSDRYVFR